MSEFEELTTRAMALPAKSRAELAELLIQSLEEEDHKEIKSAGSPRSIVEIKKSEPGPLSSSRLTKPSGKRVSPSDG